MAIELRVVQFWSEIILVISDQIALHPVQLPLLILDLGTMFSTRIVTVHACLHNNKLFET